MKERLQDLKHATDEELMLAYQEGDARGFEALYQRHSARVFGFIQSRLRDRAMADDVFQATFLKLHQTRAKYDPSLPFAPWLFTICRSSMIDIVRARRRADYHEEWNPLALESAAADTGRSTELPDLHSLSKNQRRAIELRYQEGLSFDEIAKRLDTSPANTRKLVSRAVSALRKTFRRKGDAE